MSRARQSDPNAAATMELCAAFSKNNCRLMSAWSIPSQGFRTGLHGKRRPHLEKQIHREQLPI
jgi:hypothetical protein